jgi:Tfp pilus assembly protein PilX
MLRRLRDEQDGSALIAAVMLIAICTVMGLALMNLGDGQDKMAGRERIRESSFGITEAGLDAQVARLARAWPQSATTAYPSQCDPTVASPVACPDSTEMASALTSVDAANTACAGAATTAWRTTVRDNGGSVASYYRTAAANLQPTYDANGDGLVWVRAEGRAQCRLRTIVTLVRVGLVSISFPRLTVAANWFWTTNNGRKVIVDTIGTPAGTPAPVQVRCVSPYPSPCLKVDQSKGQVSGSNPSVVPTLQTPTLSPDQLATLVARAKSLGTYYGAGSPAGSCPPSLTGALIYVEDLAACPAYSGGNSNAAPGMLVFGRGALTLGGNAIYYGLVYGLNLQATNSAAVSLQGTSAIKGAVAVDGLGGVVAGSSAANVIFDSRVLGLVVGQAGASAVPGTWRELSPGE